LGGGGGVDIVFIVRTHICVVYVVYVHFREKELLCRHVPLVSLFLLSDQAALSGLDKKLKIPPPSYCRGQAVPVVFLSLMDRRAVLRIQMKIRPDPDLISSGSYLF
jgi:hypothetical protein